MRSEALRVRNQALDVMGEGAASHLTPHASHRSSPKGFTLFEVVLAILLLAVAIVPMMNAFAPAFLATALGEDQAVLTGRARGTMNRLIDLDFRSLDANRGNPANLVALFGSQAEADKENLAYRGTTYTPAVAITDASGGAGGLLEITVTLDRISLRTLKANR